MIEDPHHKSLEFLVACSGVKCRNFAKSFSHSFRSADYVAINSELKKIDWLALFSRHCINSCLDLLYSKIYELVDMYVPCKKIHSSFPNYLSNSTMICIKEKNKAHKRWKVTSRNFDYRILSELRRRAKRAIQSDYSYYISSVESELPKN